MTLLPGHLQSREVTSVHFLLRDRHLLRVTHLWGSNVPITGVIGDLQPLPGDFRLNDVTSGSLSVT